MSEASGRIENLAELTDRLSEVLAEETRLLEALDLPAAGSLLGRKSDAVAALQIALASGIAPMRDAEDAEALRGSVKRMTELAAANRAAIERGLALQMRLIEAIARAVPLARAQEAPIYRSNGIQVPPRPPQAYAFTQRM